MSDSSLKDDHAKAFVEYLMTLRERDRGALAALRHSLAFEPGAYPKAFPYVERFAGAATHERDARRLALYAVAGLFARHPETAAQTFAAAFGQLARKRKAGSEKEYSTSIENRFVALLGADAENIFDYLRQAISLLAADDIGLNYVQLLADLSQWMNPNAYTDRLRQRWARDFYRAAQAEVETQAKPDTANAS
ncbi:CRISPR system Cascade subunit CasB [Lampropedia hyalina DSM 16112]|uniref:CRISPR system Cascade subunit CasB n=1 Tax=Lampropedia hyalina DSM 16112 TaxID=1122156 RepID=A0A1M5DVE5_9BURK|nr:type I-E CRISPR-associated protein Cse2/CasB [Lampropedia hyalina]SHF70896.1 CRISPR system Cascade subunit CasB [Lampropedia hyalina DSM 16112]